jgi:outer membrane receptor for ferrienterochelin and colicins
MPPQRSRWTAIVRAVVVAVALGMSLSAQAQSTLPDLSVEDLMKLDGGQVFGASERLQPAIEAPASVSFVTAEEIKRFGYRTLADILRGVRGFYVTDDRNFSYVGTRGFAKPGDYNSRILLLVNGHRVNDNVFGQAAIGAEFGMDPAIFERVEIIRGPASSLYGDSAFFAVVNVITRTGASLGGGSATLEVGTLGTQLVRGTSGQVFGNGAELALSGTFERSGGVGRLYFPAFDTPATNNGVAEGLDGERIGQFYARLDFKGLTVTASYGNRRRYVPTASFATLFNAQSPREETIDRHTLLDAKYERSFNHTQVTFRASSDRFSYDGIYPASVDPSVFVLNGAIGTRWSVAGGVTRALGSRQIVRAGVEFIDNLQQDQTAGYSDSSLFALQIRESSRQHALYVQDEIRLAPWLIVNAGLRYDGYQEFKRVTPRAALIYLPSATQSIKYLYGNAFRAPTAYELNTVQFGQTVLGLRPESIDTHEVVWERYVNDWLRTSVSGYWYKADRLITLIADPEASLGLTYVNQGNVLAKGLELEAQMRLSGATRALVSYALQQAVDQATQAELPNSPRHMVKGRISFSGPTRRSIVSVEAQYLSRRQTLAGATAAWGAPVTITMIQPLWPSWEIFGSVDNLFDQQYADPMSSALLQDTIFQNGRTARIGLRWSVGAK